MWPIYEKDIGLARDSSGGDQTNVLIFVGYFKLWTKAHNPVLPGGGLPRRKLWAPHKAATGGPEATAAQGGTSVLASVRWYCQCS